MSIDESPFGIAPEPVVVANPETFSGSTCLRSFITHEFGWIDGKRSQGRNGRRCNAKQRHR